MAYYITIHHEKKFIAFFSPKCGCTTLKDWFIASLELDQPLGHRELLHYMIAPGEVKKFPDYKKIFFIRNPFYRLVSFYCGFVIPEVPLWCFADGDGQYRLEGKTFAELVNTLEVLRLKGLPLQHHLEPQLQGVEGDDVDQVIAIEHLDAEIGRLNRELRIVFQPRCLNATRYSKTKTGFVFDLSPAEIARSGIPQFKWFYNPQLIEIVWRVYANDLKYYELHCGSSSQPMKAAPS